MNQVVTLGAALVLIIATGSSAAAQTGRMLVMQADASEPVVPALRQPAHLVVEEVPISTALTKLYEQSGVPVTFSPSLLPADRRVSCACDTVTVEEALNRLLAGTLLRYREIDRHILVFDPLVPRSGPIPARSTTRYAVSAEYGADASFVMAEVGREPPAVSVRQGSVSGVVVEEGSQRPLAGVQVSVVGTGIGVLTNAAGRYLLVNVPAGQVRVRAQMIGYAAAEATVAVQSGESTVQNFSLRQEALALDEVVVTGTAGGTQRRAIGAVVERLNAAQVMEKAPVANVDQLIGQRTPGLIVLPAAGQVGTGAPLRIRGASSLSLTNEPIVFIDGIRMDSDPRRGTTQRGGARVSRLNDLNPNDIESVEVIKGPAAATLYGTEASNGVIQIITKRGASGAPSFNITARMGTNWMQNPEGRAGLRWARNPQTGELESFNVYENERINGLGPIFGRGLLQGYNANVRGGTEAIRYFVSASWDDDTGIVDWNWDKRLAVRANLDLVLSDRISLRASNGYVQSRTRLAQAAINVDPFSQLIWSTPATRDQPRRGWMVAPPEEWSTVEDRADNDRTTTSLEVSYQPFSWMRHRVVAGLDLNEEKSWTLWPRQPNGSAHFFGNMGLGSKSVTRGTRRFLTADYAGTATLDVRNFALATSVGFQYYGRSTEAITATGQEFPAVPITSVTGGTVRNGLEIFEENATVGVFVQQQVGWQNRLFLTAAVRGDDNSAFGSEYDAAIYPKLSAAWVVHEEPFWGIDWVQQLRLRGAWGAAGQQPGTFDAARLYDPEIGYRDNPALVPSAFGNPQLRPERGEELELGFDASVLGGRVNLNYTRYSRRVKDAIVNRPLSPSSGFSGTQVVNLGLVQGWGNEIGLETRLLQTRRFAWDLDTQFATMGNRIGSLGGLEFIGAGGQAQHREDYGVADLFMRRLISAEIDPNGAVTSALCDGGTGVSGVDPGGEPVPCAQAPKVWWGPSQPTWQVGVGTTVTILNNLRLTTRVEGNGGHHQINTEIRAIHNLGNSEAVLRRNDPILQAYRAFENDATGAYKAGFLRLREISANYILPRSLVERFGASGGSVSFGMRNVMMLWTAEQGWSTARDGSIVVPVANMVAWDPEIRSTAQLGSDYQTIMPPTSSATMTLRLSF